MVVIMFQCSHFRVVEQAVQCILYEFKHELDLLWMCYSYYLHLFHTKHTLQCCIVQFGIQPFPIIFKKPSGYSMEQVPWDASD
jgi:hypothetical protein